MKRLKIDPGFLSPIIDLPSSKSHSNRALILASLKNGPVVIKRISPADDVIFLVKALEGIGLKFQQRHDELEVQNSFPACESPKGAIIEVGEGGTTARFLACLLLRGSSPYTLILGKRLKARPWQEFLSLAESLGAKARLEDDQLYLQGPILPPQNLDIDCTRTTQFASGFQLALAFDDVSVHPRNLHSSESYWKMTGEIISQLETKSEYVVPLDWSSASYPLAFGALKQKIQLPGLRPDENQADFKFFSLLESFHSIKQESWGIQVSPIKNFRNVEMDVSDCLDLFPALLFFLAHVPGTHVLKGIQNLSYKESDRLQEMVKILSLFQRQTSLEGNAITLVGTETVLDEELHLSLPEDHRIIMAGALFLRAHGGGSITPVAPVNKSFPRFFEKAFNLSAPL